MRPEYIAALDEARLGFTQWIIVLPSILIWIAIIRGRSVLAFVAVALVLTWACCWIHARHVQATKVAHAVTEAELQDRDFDAAYRMAYVSGAIYASILCGTNVVLAGLVASAIRWKKSHRVPAAETRLRSV